MALQTWAWLATAANAVHVMEEYTFNWRDWARGALGLPVEWKDFYVTNAVVIVLGIVSAELAPALPVAPLAYASPMLINAVLFHIWQVIRAKGRFSPGVVTAIALFLPIGIAEFVEASREGVLSGALGVGAAVAGAILMAFPIVMLKTSRFRIFGRIEKPPATERLSSQKRSLLRESQRSRRRARKASIWSLKSHS